MNNRSLALMALLALFLGFPAAARDARPAKELFGAKDRPADLSTRSIGFYSRGCLAGGVALPVDGPRWQVMRLERNRNWGHPVLVDFLQWLAREAAENDGWPGLLVGDMSQPRGGPMLTGHASHQIGLDADIWLTPMPGRRLSARERAELSAVAVVEPGPHLVDERVWTDAHLRLIRRAASHPGVERILVAPGIKRKLCETQTGDRSWLAKVRPYWGHNYHMHVRMSCPKGSPGCRAQDPPGRGHGCGAELAWWYTDEPYAASGTPAKPKAPIRLADLPPDCANVIAAADRPGTASAAGMFVAAGGDAPPATSRPMEAAAATGAGSATLAGQPPHRRASMASPLNRLRKWFERR
jgi:penicillin-insensitive murein endopeptidase